MAGKPERIDHDPYASRRQPQQGERETGDSDAGERGQARPSQRDERRTREPHPAAPQRPASADPADDLMQGGD